MTGLRERKKRQTRERISDIATGLFLEHSFDTVTIAEIADAAEVSVNTVYNYFPSKEDLFFDREEEMVERYASLVRERGPGQSAARVMLDQLRQDITARSPYVGLTEGHGRFLRVMRESPALMARLWGMQHRIGDRLIETLRTETGADADDPLPELVAVQLMGAHNVVFGCTARGVEAGRKPDEVAEEALRRIEAYESLLSDTVLNYATKSSG